MSGMSVAKENVMLRKLLLEAQIEISDWERNFPSPATANDGATAKLLKRIKAALSQQPLAVTGEA